MIHNTLRLVKVDDNFKKCTKLAVIENIHNHFRATYQNFYSADLEETRKGNRAWRKETWLIALEEYSADTINTVLEAILQGRTPFSRNEPTPAQYAQLCAEVDEKLNEALEARSRELDRFE